MIPWGRKDIQRPRLKSNPSSLPQLPSLPQQSVYQQPSRWSRPNSFLFRRRSRLARSVWAILGEGSFNLQNFAAAPSVRGGGERGSGEKKLLRRQDRKIISVPKFYFTKDEMSKPSLARHLACLKSISQAFKRRHRFPTESWRQQQQILRFCILVFARSLSYLGMNFKVFELVRFIEFKCTRQT